MPLLAAIGGLGLALLLGGCTALGIPHQRETEPAESARPTTAPTPAPAPPQVEVPDGTIAATGAFSGTVGGRVEIVRADGWWRLDLIDLSLPEDRSYGLYLLGEPPASAECSDSFWSAGLGGATPGGEQLELWPDPFFEDPSYLAGVLVSPDGDAGPCRGAGRPVAGWAPLSWAVPDLRPDVRPVDAGPGDGARGELVDGHYWVVEGDIYAAIADRFGLSVEALDYLNVLHPYGERQFDLQAGCTLNVAKADRGYAERCAWYD